VVYLKDAKFCIRVAVGKGIESGAKQNILFDATLNRLSQVVFGITAARDEKRAQRDREGPVIPQRSSPQFFGVSRAEERNGNRVVKDHGRVVNLVSRATQGHPEGGFRWDGLVHRLLGPALDDLVV
jgi:hypothetical protein